MMTIEPVPSPNELDLLKRQYLEQATAPLDGMWLCGFVPTAKHFGFRHNGDLVGYCCVNSDGYLLQFFVAPQHSDRASGQFAALLRGHASPVGEIAGAFVSTAEPLFLSQCLDHFSKFTVNALMYQLDRQRRRTQPTEKNDIALLLVAREQLGVAVDFAAATLGAPAQWLKAYYGNLIDRRELYAVWNDERLVATGERRGYDDYQTRFADVGVVVAEGERGRGLATAILKRLVALNEAAGLQSICSTEKSNTAAQKAIARAGFIARNRIVQFVAESRGGDAPNF